MGLPERLGGRVGSVTINKKQVGVREPPEVGRWDFQGRGFQGAGLINEGRKWGPGRGVPGWRSGSPNEKKS